MKRMNVTRKVEYDPLAPIQFLVIFDKDDFVQFDYPEDFLNEKSIKELILPRTSDEVERAISQSRLTCTDGGMRFSFRKPEGIESLLRFNGRSARSGLSLEVFKEKVRMKLYEEGLNDLEIGRKLKLTRSAIQAWRQKRGFKSNFSRGGQRLSEDEEEKRMKLYEEGLNDLKIGKKLKLTGGAISAWRTSRKLPSTISRSKYPDKEKAVLSYLEKHGPTTRKELISNTIITNTDIQKLLRTLFDEIECIWFKFGSRDEIGAYDLFGDLTLERIFALRDDPRTLDYILEKSPLKSLDPDRRMKTSIVQRYGKILDKERAQELVRRATEFQRLVKESEEA